MNAPPNILFLMTDEQRFDNVGYINKAVKTPALDALAAESVVFTQAYTSNPSCVPARAAIFTGKYPHQCGAPTYITYLPEHETTFMTRLQELGYYTACVGKQHFGDTKIEKGYDYADIIDSHAPFYLCDAEDEMYVEENSYHRFLKAEGFSSRQELTKTKKDEPHLHSWNVDTKYHVDDFVGEQGKRWLKEGRPTGRPWYCTISFPGPHLPIDCIDTPYADLYDPAEIDMPETDWEDLLQKPEYNHLEHGHPPKLRPRESAETIRNVRHAYYANCSLIDEKIGQILELLKKLGEYDNTLIFFTSDHGDYLGDYEIIGKAQNIFEVLMRVPFLMKPPVEDFSGHTESSLISTIDIAATCIAQAGGEIPAEMAARDLSYYWEKADNLNDREHIYMEARDVRCIRTRKWKYAYYAGRDYGELYDLERDPWEKENLWDQEDLNSVKADMQKRLLDTLIQLSPRSHVPWNIGAPRI